MSIVQTCLRCGSRARHLRLGACIDFPHGFHAVRATEAPLARPEAPALSLRDYLNQPETATLTVAELRRLIGLPPPKAGG